MGDREMIQELFDRYVYAVVKRLPQKQRSDISRELSSLLDDMLESRGEMGKPALADAQALLLELGDPKQLAEKYREPKRYLIGPDFYGNYSLVLKIVLLCTAFGMALAKTLEYFLERPETLWIFAGQGLFEIFLALVQAFTWVTVIFALLERFGKKEKGLDDKLWSPTDLPPVPKEKTDCKRGESAASIVFTVLAIILFNFFPWVIGAYYQTDAGIANVPVFQLDLLRGYLPLINLAFGLGLLRELMILVAGRYSVKLGVAVLFLNLAAMALCVAVFADGSIWNPDFPLVLSEFADFQDFDIVYYWKVFQQFFTGVLIFAFALDSGTTLYHGIRSKE